MQPIEIWNVIEWDGLGYEEYARWPFSSREKAEAFIVKRNAEGDKGPYRLESGIVDSGERYDER